MADSWSLWAEPPRSRPRTSNIHVNIYVNIYVNIWGQHGWTVVHRDFLETTNITKGEQLPISKAVMEKLLVFLTLPQESADWSDRLEQEDRGAGLMKFFLIFNISARLWSVVVLHLFWRTTKLLAEINLLPSLVGCYLLSHWKIIVSEITPRTALMSLKSLF